MSEPTTFNVGPTPALMRAAYEHVGVPLGGALVVNDDGTTTLDTSAEDFGRVMSLLSGQVLADYIAGTRVLPSNVNRLREVLRNLLPALRGAETGRITLMDAEGIAGELQEAHAALESVIANLDGFMGPVQTPTA